MLTILSYGDGTCIWCRQTTEGVQAEFRDGLQGFLCKKHFWQALKVRTESGAVAVADPREVARQPKPQILA